MTDIVNLGYIGSKLTLSDSIIENIIKFTNESIENKTVGDLFAGAGSMSRKFKENKCKVIANDSELYSFYIISAHLQGLYTENVKTIIEDINNILSKTKLDSKFNGLIFNNYSENANRKYFTPLNAQKIDIVRKYIQSKFDNKCIDINEYRFLIASLIVSVDKVANTASVYGAFLKKYKTSATKDFILLPIHKNNIDYEFHHTVYNKDIMDLLDKDTYDIVYLDPPYNSRQYSKNYHLLNYIINYDELTELYGITGLFKDCFISDFCKKTEIERLFDDLFKNLKSKYIFLSYNNESLITKEVILKIINKYCSKYELIETDYNKFKSNKNNNEKKIKEYLFCCQKIYFL